MTIPKVNNISMPSVDGTVTHKKCIQIQWNVAICHSSQSCCNAHKL